jgi:flagellin
MLSLHTNAASLSAQNAISRTQENLSTSMTRLSTGYRVNSAMDDAAGLQIATRLKAQTSGMATASRNTQNSISLLQTAEGAFDEINNMLVRMKDLATQSADVSSTEDDRTALQSEYDALGQELFNVMNNTTFGGNKLLVGGTVASSMVFQIGASADEKMTIDLAQAMTDADAGLLAVSGSNYNAAGAVGTEIAGADGTAANGMLATLNDAIDLVSVVRSALGAAANRLDHVATNLANISTNTKNATGRIMDVDFASESASMTSSQMLLQAGTAMLKQSNSQSSLVLSLLQ